MQKILIIFEMVIVIAILIYGWTMPEYYPDELFMDGQSHLFGLKFMPPCKPEINTALCGYDWIFILFLVILTVITVFILVPSEEVNQNKKIRWKLK